MRRLLAAGIIGSAVGLAACAMAAMPPAEGDTAPPVDTCQGELNDLVIYLEETAEVEGTALFVEWCREGGVVLRYKDFSQFMWCQDGELHIRCCDPSDR